MTNEVIETTETTEEISDEQAKIDALTQIVNELKENINTLTKDNNELKVLNEKLTLRVSAGAEATTQNDGDLFNIFNKYKK